MAAHPGAKSNDADYVFITFILKYLPHGVIGLLIAAFFAAALSSKAAELNALDLGIQRGRDLTGRQPDPEALRGNAPVGSRESVEFLLGARRARLSLKVTKAA